MAALVGRRAELEICENALRGGSGLVLVTGDAGIGKTRLVTEVLIANPPWQVGWCLVTCRGRLSASSSV